MKSIKNIPGIIIFILFAFFVFKSCIKEGFVTANYNFYSLEREDGVEERIVILPQNRMHVIREKNELHEAGLFKFYTVNANHYFGPIYNIGTFPFGLRIYNNAESVWKLELELIHKDGNIMESTFPEIGEEIEMILVYFDSTIILGQDSYKEYYLDSNNLNDYKIMADSILMQFANK